MVRGARSCGVRVAGPVPLRLASATAPKCLGLACRARSRGGDGSSRSRPPWRASPVDRVVAAPPARTRRDCRERGVVGIGDQRHLALAGLDGHHRERQQRDVRRAALVPGTADLRGWMPSASATFWPYMNWCADVGTLTNTASTTDLSMPCIGQRGAAGLDVQGTPCRDPRKSCRRLRRRADAGDHVAAAQGHVGVCLDRIGQRLR